MLHLTIGFPEAGDSKVSGGDTTNTLDVDDIVARRRRMVDKDGLNHKSTRVDTTILGVSITSKEELIGLVEKIEAVALDDEISGLTTAERDAAHALILDLARCFNYVNLDSDDTPSEEPSFNSLVSKVTLIDDDTTP
ncbi:hypothetical protein Tco_0069727, partial [Tanacetum coccineum]